MAAVSHLISNSAPDDSIGWPTLSFLSFLILSIFDFELLPVVEWIAYKVAPPCPSIPTSAPAPCVPFGDVFLWSARLLGALLLPPGPPVPYSPSHVYHTQSVSRSVTEQSACNRPLSD